MLKVTLGIAFVFIFNFFIYSAAIAASAGSQKCIEGSTCSVGEYLYDDTYTPITDATCTITSRFPNGTLFLNAQAMTSAAENDGWYSYTFDTTGMSLGLYRSQITCSTGGDTLRLDKSFSIEKQIDDQVWNATAGAFTENGSFGSKLQNAVPQVSDIWNYSSRTLSDFGSLVSDIWGYSVRSLSTFGTLAADVWSSATRTLTGASLDNGESLATKTDVNSATSSATASIKGSGNKDLTEINTGIATAQSSLNTIETKVDTLDSNVDSISTNVTTLLNKWGAYSISDVIGYVDDLESNLGTNADSCSASTVFGGIKCIRDKWGSQTADSLYIAANNAATYSASLRTELNYNGKSSTAYEDLQEILAYVESLNTNVGDSNDLATDLTLFGKIQSTKNDIATSTASIKGPSNKSLSDVSTEVAGVQTTTNTISTNVDTLTTKVDTLDANVDTILTKWGAYSMSDLMTAINNLDSSNLGDSADTCLDSTIFGQVNCIKGKWGSRTADDIYNTAVATDGKIDNLRTELDYNGKSTTAYEDLQEVITQVNSMQTKIGTSADTSAQNTLYGRLKLNQETIEDLDTSGAGLSDLLAKWGSYSASDIVSEINSIASDVAVVNSISGVSEILTLSKSSSSNLDSLKNSVLALQALTEANKTLLESGSQGAIIQSWLEEGSIVFKTLITNPTSIRKTVPLKFYLPKEAKKQDILKIDDGLTVGFDPSEDAYFVSGEFTLAPNETRIFAVEVEDIWKISEKELTSIKLQAKELYEPLKETTYFAQGATLYADVVASVDRASRIQSEAITPEARIKAYRDASIEVERAKTGVENLKTLGTSASSAGNLFGFVGGVQAVAVWGLIIVLTAGFIFLSIYMKMLINNEHKSAPKEKGIEKSYKQSRFRKPNKKIIVGILGFIIFLIVMLLIGLFIFSSISDHVVEDDAEEFTHESISQEELKLEVENKIPEEVKMEEEKQVLGAKTNLDQVLIVASGSGINLREGPSLRTKVVTKIKSRIIADKINSSEGWHQIEFTDPIKSKAYKGWIKADLTQKYNP